MFCITRKVLRVREFRRGFFPLLFSSFSALAASLFLLCGCATRIHAQEFGGCHCVPLHPKPIAQLDQERNALINELNRNRTTRKELIHQFKEHSLRQEEIWKEFLILNKRLFRLRERDFPTQTIENADLRGLGAVAFSMDRKPVGGES